MIVPACTASFHFHGVFPTNIAELYALYLRLNNSPFLRHNFRPFCADENPLRAFLILCMSSGLALAADDRVSTTATTAPELRQQSLHLLRQLLRLKPPPLLRRLPPQRMP